MEGPRSWEPKGTIGDWGYLREGGVGYPKERNPMNKKSWKPKLAKLRKLEEVGIKSTKNRVPVWDKWKLQLSQRETG